MEDNTGQYERRSNDDAKKEESSEEIVNNTNGTSSKKRRTVRRAAGIALLICCCVLISSVSGGISAYVVYTLLPLFEREKTTSAISTEADESREEPIIMNPIESEYVSETENTLPEQTEIPEQTQPETSAAAIAPVTEESTEPLSLSASRIYSENVNSVVGVRAYSTKKVTVLFGLYTTKEVVSSGSGFFVTSDGYIITNNHVIDGAHTYKVSLYDGSEHDAVLVGGDASNDIAVLKVEGSGFKSVELGKSGDISVGDSVLIIGNALGELSFSLTSGVVSFLNRNVSVNSHEMYMNQTDAAINVGNSGGPVFDNLGRVIGIASAKMSSESIEGLGFFIPIDDVKDRIMSIING